VSTPDLKRLLDQVPDHGELVLRREDARSAAYAAWVDAHEEARTAYAEWRRLQTAEAYAAYRAAQDREDAAQDTLAQEQAPRARAA
jgi:hypothetical protein